LVDIQQTISTNSAFGNDRLAMSLDSHIDLDIAGNSLVRCLVLVLVLVSSIVIGIVISIDIVKLLLRILNLLSILIDFIGWHIVIGNGDRWIP
jgi:hypothetical protein